MKPLIHATATPALRKEYRRLLTSDWKKRTVEEVLELLWKEVGGSHGLKELPFGETLRPDRAAIRPSELNEEVLEKLRHFRHHFGGNGLVPPVPDHFAPRKASRLRSRAETTWTYLILASLAELRGDTGLLADTQSLLFLLAADFLLADLERRADDAERSCLVNALYLHTFVPWGEDPQRQAHHFFLQAVLMDHLGRPELRQENLRLALSLTPVEDHAYLTKLQAYVFALLDAERGAEAKKALLSVYRRAPETYLAEIEEMIDGVEGRPGALRA
jgi:hypothetical protein